jgi:hypothetical protein
MQNKSSSEMITREMDNAQGSYIHGDAIKGLNNNLENVETKSNGY